MSALKHSGSSGDKSSSTDTGDPSNESSSGKDILAAVYLLTVTMVVMRVIHMVRVF